MTISRRVPILERFLRHVTKHPETLCWNWIGANSRGYGLFRLDNGKMTGAHRAGYLLFVGALDQNKQLHHTCRNRSCCNPDHLQALTDAEHKVVDPSSMRNRTHCKNGHPLEGDNLVANRKKVGLRLCRICNLARTKRQRHDRGDEFKLYNRESQKAWRLANPEHCAAYRKAYRAKAKEATRRYRERQKAKALAAVPT
jgi:hypothetical protein